MKKKVTKIKKKVIEAHFTLKNPATVLWVVYASNSIDETILDLQEIYPDRGISRSSMLTWKFLTVAEFNALELEKKGAPLLNKEQGSTSE